MIKVAATMVLALAITFSEGRTAEATSAAQPQVNFVTTVADFGTVKMGQDVGLEFQIRNTGSAPLVIEQARHRPHIKIRFSPEIPPDGTANISVEIDTKQISGETSDNIILVLNDPDRPQVVLTVKGVVVPPIDIVPRPVVYLSIYEGDTAERSLLLINHQQRPLSITRIEPQGGHFEANLEPIEEGRRFRLQISVPRDTLPGRYRESVVLHTDDPKYGRLLVAVNVLVKRDVYVSRDELSFGQVNLAQLRQNPGILALLSDTFLVKRREGDMAITSVDTDVPFLNILQDPPERSQIFRFDVGLNLERIVPGKIDGTIRIETDDPEFPELVVPVRGEIKE